MEALEILAREVISKIKPSLSDNFVNIVLFSFDNPGLRVMQRKSVKNPNPEFGTKEHLTFLAKKYVHGREPKQLPYPQTVPDPALGTVLETGYRKDKEDLNTLIEGHRIAMVAENVVGELLERYIDTEISDDDWIWCAGEVVKSVDFIRKSAKPNTKWESLQVKNRDNSENSSSSAIRAGTEIVKWHRTVSRTGATKWDSFPIGGNSLKLSEEGFEIFLRNYLAGMTDLSEA